MAHTKDFVKIEKIVRDSSKVQIPRLIRPRSPEYNVAVGRYIRQLEPFLYSRLSHLANEGCAPSMSYKVVMKGLNAFQQATEIVKAATRLGPSWTCIGIDASRWDQHVSEAMLQWEHNVYTSCFAGTDKELLSTLLRLQCRTK